MTSCLGVKKPGVLMSIQDLGRFGYRRFGVPQSGALQPELMKIANALVANNENTAVLEFFLTGPTLYVEEGSLSLAVAGDCILKMTRGDKHRIFRAWRSVKLQAGDTLEIGQIQSGRVGYIAVSKGFSLKTVMESEATYLRGSFGGLNGKALQSGDHLIITEAPETLTQNLYLPSPPQSNIPGSHQISTLRVAPVRIRVILGPQDDYFTKESLYDFLHGTYVISRESDRMGSRLEGPQLNHQDDEKTEIISDGLIPGAIQVPGSGNPIVIFVDGPTVGGYPKIATVITADLPKLAAMPPGSRLYFESASVEEAEILLRASRGHLADLLTTITPLPKMAEPF